ncbi:hypothetical protein ACOME3_002324 [Neoechinorhynchus agilis]
MNRRFEPKFFSTDDIVAPEADLSEEVEPTIFTSFREVALRTPDWQCGELPEALRRMIPSAWLLSEDNGSFRLGLSLVYNYEQGGRVWNRDIEVRFSTVSEFGKEYERISPLTLLEMCSGLTDIVRDGAWLQALKNTSQFVGGVRAQDYQPGHAKAIKTLMSRKVQPERFVMRMAAVYCAQALREAGAQTKRRLGGARTLRWLNVNNSQAHGDLLIQAVMGRSDIVYVPSEVGDPRTVLAAVCLAASPEFPFRDMLLGRTAWPNINNPLIAYSRLLDTEYDLEELNLPATELWNIYSRICHHYGRTNLWWNMVRGVMFDALRVENLAFQGPLLEQYTPMEQ